MSVEEYCEFRESSEQWVKCEFVLGEVSLSDIINVLFFISVVKIVLQDVELVVEVFCSFINQVIY